MAFLDRKDHRRVDPSASSGPGRGSGSTSCGCDINGSGISGTADGLLAEACDEEAPIRLESSEGDDVTSGDVPRERGPMFRRSGVPWDSRREDDNEGEFEVGVEGALSGR